MESQEQCNSDSEKSNIPQEIMALLPMKRQRQSNCDTEGFNFLNEITERIFWRLPLKFTSQAKTVCKAWNSLFSSTEFWSHHPGINPNHAWLMFCIDHPTLPNIVYSLSTNIWKTISITFMPRYKTGVKYYASSRGILLVGIGAYPQTLFVCNPLITQFRQLPPTLSIEINSFTPKGIVFCEDDVHYKVVAIGTDHSKGKKVVEIYSFSNSSWTTAGEIPLNYTLGKEIVFCKTWFFCLISHPKNLMVYSTIKEDGCKKMRYVSLPVTIPNRHTTVHYSLVALRASLLLTSAIQDNFCKFSDVRIWEFQMIDGNAEGGPASSDSLWKEIARMPESMCEEFGRHRFWYECVGEGDYACFKNGRSDKVVTYNLRERSWKWLPPSPLRWVRSVHTIRGFALKPDFKL